LSEQGVLQGSSLSPILFLFYNADLIDACNPSNLPTTGIGFVDDTNVLAFEKSTEGTCSVLKKIYSSYLTWEDKLDASFAPRKFVHVHYPNKKAKSAYCPT
jgi:hypothetical protein